MLPSWGSATLNLSEIDLGGPHNTPVTSRADLLARFDKNVAETRAALVGKTDAEMMARLVAEAQRPEAVHDAEGRGVARFRPESSRPSSRAARVSTCG